MTDNQEPTPEALAAAHELHSILMRSRLVDSLHECALALDRFAADRVLEAYERCAQIALEYRDETDAGKHPDAGDPDHSLGQGFAANVIAKRIKKETL